jgi:two-component system sensor histidine kinase UhpB
LFRVLQEGLTNVHRHSASTSVEIRVSLSNEQVQMEIQDYGQGISPSTLALLLDGGIRASVGVAGMRERARELGGSLQIKSAPTGTLVTLILPLTDSAEKYTILKNDIARS